MQTFELKLRYKTEHLDGRALDAYDGSTSILGFSQAAQIALHAYLNGEVVSRAPALKGAKLFIRPPREGSFLLQIIALIEQYPTTVAITAPVFYDFMKVTFKRAVGFLNEQPETPYVRRLLEREEPMFDSLAEQMEGSLQRAHRAVDTDVPIITLERPRSELVTFDKHTKDWVTTRDENPNSETLFGNVTRYNSVSRNGRMFVEELDRIIPFRPADSFNRSKDGNLTWSLHGNATGQGKRLRLTAKRIESARGEAKRLLLTNCAAVET